MGTNYCAKNGTGTTGDTGHRAERKDYSCVSWYSVTILYQQWLVLVLSSPSSPTHTHHTHTSVVSRQRQMNARHMLLLSYFYFIFYHSVFVYVIVDSLYWYSEAVNQVQGRLCCACGRRATTLLCTIINYCAI